ncbi:hypothetical protein NKG05_02155 [Oerskovia sp. M15]
MLLNVPQLLMTVVAAAVVGRSTTACWSGSPRPASRSRWCSRSGLARSGRANASSSA